MFYTYPINKMPNIGNCESINQAILKEAPKQILNEDKELITTPTQIHAAFKTKLQLPKSAAGVSIIDLSLTLQAFQKLT